MVSAIAPASCAAIQPRAATAVRLLAMLRSAQTSSTAGLSILRESFGSARVPSSDPI